MIGNRSRGNCDDYATQKPADCLNQERLAPSKAMRLSELTCSAYLTLSVVVMLKLGTFRAFYICAAKLPAKLIAARLYDRSKKVIYG